MGGHNISWQCLLIQGSHFAPPPPALYVTKEKKAAETLAAHPLQARPVGVEEQVSWEAAHVVEAPLGATVLGIGTSESDASPGPRGRRCARPTSRARIGTRRVSTSQLE